jgi:hypothetical protein
MLMLLVLASELPVLRLKEPELELRNAQLACWDEHYKDLNQMKLW